jgi:arylsulfatase A-like enzyme
MPVILALALTLAAAPAVTPAPPRLVVISWDGAPDWAVDRLLAEGQLPNLARLAARGAVAAHSVAAFPSKTAAGHAALWTGCWGDCNGVTGNSVPVLPRAEHTLLEAGRGFSSEALTAEPLYVTAAKAGRRTAVLSATQVYPFAPHLATLAAAGVPADRFLAFSGFEHEIAPGRLHGADELQPAGTGWRDLPPHDGRLLELESPCGDSTLVGLAFDDPADPVAGLDTVLIRRSRADAAGQARVKPRAAAAAPLGWSAPFVIRRGDLEGATLFRLFDLAPDGSRLALYRRAAHTIVGAGPPEAQAAYRAADPAFHDDPFWLYQRDGFGPTLISDGDGEAERRVLEIVAHDCDLLIAGSHWALGNWRADVLFHYSPMTDSAGHAWVGALDPTAPGHDPALAARVWPRYAAVFHELDRWLGAVVEAAGPDAVVAVVSDHGMAGVNRFLDVNRILERAGLLARLPGGGIDLAGTRVLAPAFGDFFLAVNDTSWLGGIVVPAERDRVLDAAVAALLAARDPDTGYALIERVFRPEQFPGRGIGGPRGGDLYFDPAPGLYPAQLPTDRIVAPLPETWGAGMHGFDPERRTMHATFVVAGPGVAAGTALPAMRQIDVAPTLARLAGMPAPPQAVGHVIGGALAPCPSVAPAPR